MEDPTIAAGNPATNTEKQEPEKAQEVVAAPPPTPVVKDPTARFRGIGTNFKAKLIGVDDVEESRGDKMCQDSILKLKAAVKASGQHKQKIIINVSLDGLKVVDLISGEIQHEHQVNRISFIARDLTDRRAFGYIYGTSDGKHHFFGIKTAKIAEHLVLALRDLFQVVYDMKKDEIAKKTEAQDKEGGDAVYAVPNNRPAVKRSDGSLVDLKQQMQNMQQMSGLDAFTPWPENTPTSPDTPGSPPATNDADLFGMANLSDISSLSSDFSLASTSNSVQDTPKIGEKYPKNNYSPQNFHRTSSGKSAKSWQGSSNHWFQRNKTRHSSMSGGNRKNSFNKNDTPERNIPSLNKVEQKPDKNSDKDNVPPVFIDSGQLTENPPENVDRNSFFDEVMGAVSANFSPAHDGSTQGVEKTYSTDDVNSSASSVTSTDSKRKTPQKSLSIASFFSSSSKKQKKKNLNSPKQTPVSLSGSSESNSSKGVISKSLSNKSINSNTISTKSNTSLNLTNEPTYANKLSRGLSLTSISSAPDSYRSDESPKTRIPPSLAIARARPRKTQNLQRKSSGNKSNPPMFKSKLMSNDKTDNTNTDEKSSKSLTRTESNASSGSAQQNLTNFASWASFDEQTPPESITETGNTTSQSDWCSFNDPPKQTTPDKDNFAWNDTNTIKQSESQSTENPFASDFSKETEAQVDPFSSEVAFVDPFAELVLENPVEEDPFADIEETFGFGANNNSQLPVVHENIDDKIIEKTEDSFDNLSDNNILSDLNTDNSFPSPSRNPNTFSSEDNWITATEIESSGTDDYITSSAPPQLPPPELPPMPPRTPPLLPSKYNNDPNLPQSNFVQTSPSFSPPSTPPTGPPPELPQIAPPIVPPRIPPRPASHPSDNIVPPPLTAPPPLPTNTQNKEESSSESEDEEKQISDKFKPELKPPAFPPPALPSRNFSKTPTHEDSDKQSDLSAEENNKSSAESSEFNSEARNMSYSDDLAALSVDAVQPAAAPGAKKTKDQILAGFGTPGAAMGGQGMFPPQQQMPGMYQQQQNPYMAQQQMGMQGNPFPAQQQQQGMYGGASMPSVPAANPFAASAYGAPAVAPMFRGPSPAIPARPGAMRQPQSNVAPSGAPQNPFGDALGGGPVSNGLMEPINLKANLQNEQGMEEKGKSDPFASLLPGLGGGSSNKKDMFKNFQMAKPEPPPRSGDSVSPNFDSYLRNSVGGVPVKPSEMNNNAPASAPVAAPRSTPNQAAGDATNGPSDDPFGMFNDNSSNFFTDNQQQQSNTQSLFG